MIRVTVNYEDLDGKNKTVEGCFHLTKHQLTKLEVSYPGGISAAMEKAVLENDRKSIIDVFDDMLSMAYGKRVGDRFVQEKSDLDEFIQIGAYSALFVELISDDVKLTKFVRDLLPKDLLPPES